MDLSDPFQLSMLVFAAGVFLAAFYTRVAAILFLWWTAGMAAYFLTPELPSQAFYAFDGIAAVAVGLFLRRGTDAFILWLFVFPLVARLTGDVEIDWFVSWCVGMIQMGLAMVGAWLKMRPVAICAIRHRKRRKRIQKGLRFVQCL